MLSFPNISYGLGWLIIALAGAMAVPATVGLAYAELSLSFIFLISAVVTGFCGGALVIAVHGAQSNPITGEKFLLALLGWTILPFFAAIPIYAAGIDLGFTNAYFEATSGMTTTGATIFLTPETLPRSILVWRSTLEWVGGFFTLLMAVMVLAPAGIGGLELRRAHFAHIARQDWFSRVFATGWVVLSIYLSLTLVLFALVWSFGVPAFEALCLSLSTVSTGGFSVHSESFAAFDAPIAEIAIAVFLIAGATNFSLHYQALGGHLRAYADDSEMRGFLAIILAGAFAILISSIADGKIGEGIGLFSIIWGSLLSAISLLTTAGIQFSDAMALRPIHPIIVIGLILVGGTTLSTAGGIKLLRIILLMRQSARELQRLEEPHGISRAKFQGREVDLSLMGGVWSLFILFLLTYVFVALGLAAMGLDFIQALVAGGAALSNAGPALNLIFPQEIGTQGVIYSTFSPAAKWWLAFAMIGGRTELLILLSLFHLRYWRG